MRFYIGKNNFNRPSYSGQSIKGKEIINKLPFTLSKGIISEGHLGECKAYSLYITLFENSIQIFILDNSKCFQKISDCDDLGIIFKRVLTALKADEYFQLLTLISEHYMSIGEVNIKTKFRDLLKIL